MKLRIREIAEQVGIKNASHLRTVTGLGVGTCYQIWDGSLLRIDLETLNTLCNKLQVGPAMLFEYTPDVEPVTGSAQGEGPTKPKATPGQKGPRVKRGARAAGVSAL